MEELIEKFPLISARVFKNLSNQDLKNVQEVNQLFHNFIQNEKYLLIRIITKNIKKSDENQKLWRKVWKKNNVEIIRIIACSVQRGPIHNGRTPLHFAASVGDIEVFLNIFQRFQDKNPKDCKGFTPLYLAAQNGHLEICQSIIDKVEDKNPKTINGFTPLYGAAENGHLEICQLIIDKIEDKNLKTNEGLVPLYVAAINGHLEICQLIIHKV